MCYLAGARTVNISGFACAYQEATTVFFQQLSQNVLKSALFLYGCACAYGMHINISNSRHGQICAYSNSEIGGMDRQDRFFYRVEKSHTCEKNPKSKENTLWS